MLTNEQKLEEVEQRFRKGSKSYQAARFIVQHEGEIDEENKGIIASEVGMANKTLEGVFSKLRKLGLYGVINDIDLGYPIVPQEAEKPVQVAQHPEDMVQNPQIQPELSQVAQHQAPVPQEQYVTLEDFNVLKNDFKDNIQFLVSAIRGDITEEEGDYNDDRYIPPVPPTELEIRDPSLMRKTIWFKPKATMYYDLARQGVFHTYTGSSDVGPLSGFKGNLSDFINVVIDDYFVRNFNADIGLLMRRYV